MASIRKNPNGTYTATVYVGRDNDGKMLRKYVTRDGLKECKTVARELEQGIEKRDLTSASMMKMSSYMPKWLAVNKPLLSPTTIKAYRLYIEKHFLPAFGKMKVCDITDMHIKAYIADKLSDLSPTTVRKHYFTMSRMLKDALKHASPCVGVKPPKNGDYRATVPTEAQFDDIRRAFASLSPEHEAVILLAGWCGLRRGEIFALKWDDIDENKDSIRVDEALALTEDKYKFELKRPKSRNGIRSLVAPTPLIQLLGQIKQAQKSLRHEVFSITPGSFSNLYVKVVKEHDLPKVRFHDLRHYHASILYKHNVPDLYAAERLGHDIWVLKKIYQHLGLEEKKDLDEKVKGLFL